MLRLRRPFFHFKAAVWPPGEERHAIVSWHFSIQTGSVELSSTVHIISLSALLIRVSFKGIFRSMTVHNKKPGPLIIQLCFTTADMLEKLLDRFWGIKNDLVTI